MKSLDCILLTPPVRKASSPVATSLQAKAISMIDHPQILCEDDQCPPFGWEIPILY